MFWNNNPMGNPMNVLMTCPLAHPRLARLAAPEGALQHLGGAALLRQLHGDETLGDLLHLGLWEEAPLLHSYGSYGFDVVLVWFNMVYMVNSYGCYGLIRG